MIVSEIEDVLLQKYGTPTLAPSMMAFIRKAARSEIESKGNFYWQARQADITIATGDHYFQIAPYWTVPDFQEFRFLALVKDGRYRFIFPGSYQSTLEGVLVPGETGSAGFPERATYENGYITLSPDPEEEVEGKLFYFASTEEPEDASGTDELYTSWPQLMLFQCLAVGERLLNKGADAGVWEELAQQQIEAALDQTAKLLGEPRPQISPSVAAKVLQAQVGK